MTLRAQGESLGAENAGSLRRASRGGEGEMQLCMFARQTGRGAIDICGRG